MSTEIKPILILILVCATIFSIGIVKVEKTKSELANNVSNNVTSEDINEIIESEIIVPPKKESSESKDSQQEPTESGNVTTSENNSSISYDDRNVPDNSIKSYMDYRRITNRNSRQYILQQRLAYTGNFGIRMVGDRYCVAVGSYYTTTVGQWIDIELENGTIIRGILADCKADKHTDSTNRVNPNGSVVEFVVDTKALNNTTKITGDMSYVEGWNSKVINIKVYDFVQEF